MTRIAGISRNGHKAESVSLELELRDPLLVAYFEQFEEPDRSTKAHEALKVGVIALQTASPTLDAEVVKDQFAELQQDFGQELARYFAEKDGVVPKSLNAAFGERGQLSLFIQRYFDPENGRFAKLMEAQIGPTSRFAKLFDPKNKESVVVVMEEKVKQLVEAKLNDVLGQLSLDHDDSAMSRLKAMIDAALSGIRESLGIKAACAKEAARGHVKGFDFEHDLYAVVAKIARQFGDDTDLVRGTPGSLKCKTGDHLITLGETSGAPGVRIVVEVKDQDYKAKKAIAELQEAKKNREAVSGIFVFAKGREPVELGNFKRIDNDFYCTVEKSELENEAPMTFLAAAYELARVQAVLSLRKEADGTLDIERIQQHMDAICSWIPRLGDILTKANTVQNSGKAIESTAKEIKEDIERRAQEVLKLLQRDAA